MYDEAGLIVQLEQLPKSHRVAFAAACAERLYPSYVAFSNLEHAGSPAALRNVLDILWSMLPDETGPNGLKGLMAECEDLAPDSDDYSSVFVGPAQRSAGSAYYTLLCYTSGAATDAALAARMVVESIEEYLELASEAESLTGLSNELIGWFKNNDVLDTELQEQQRDIFLLHNSPSLTAYIVAHLRQSSVEHAIPPLSIL